MGNNCDAELTVQDLGHLSLAQNIGQANISRMVYI